MTVNQISIFLENKYGKLSEILALLAEERIRIIAATVADTSEYGILRIIVKRSPEGIQDIRKQRQRKPDRRISDRKPAHAPEVLPIHYLISRKRASA